MKDTNDIKSRGVAQYGKKTRNPGYEAGNHWLECQRCSFDIRSKEAKREWNGLIVCASCYEPRQPQDVIRAKADKIRPVGLVNTESPLVEKTVIYTGCQTKSAIPGYAIPGCAIPGDTTLGIPEPVSGL